LEETAHKVNAIIETVPGVVDAFDGIVVSGPALMITVDPLRAAVAGLQPADVRDQLTTMIRGSAETQVQHGEKLIAIRVRFPKGLQEDIHAIETLSLINASGKAIPLKSVARIDRVAGQTEIHRERLRQFVAVTARISGRDLGRTVADIQKELTGRLALPSGVTIEYGGVYQTQQESFRGLLIVSLAAFLLVCIVLIFEFESYVVPIAVFIVSLLSLFGVFGALWVSGNAFNISSFVGIIMIIGIVAENAVFVLHTTRILYREGAQLEAAVIMATRMRARPILMTTLAAVLALLPLALGIGAGSQMQQPLAIAVIGGFSVSSLMLFFALPLIVRLLMLRSRW
jgi:multidrug efflux pump subunit AcrB